MLTCSFDVTGEVNATYTNSTGVLTVSNSTRLLTVVNASAGCAGIAAVGDHPTFNGDFTVVTPPEARRIPRSSAPHSTARLIPRGQGSRGGPRPRDPPPLW